MYVLLCPKSCLPFCAFVATLLFSLSLNAQLSQSTWLAGGSGTFYSQSQNWDPADPEKVKGVYWEANPAAGYFFADKWAAGLKAKLRFSKITYQFVRVNDKVLGVGPFLRYYFFPKDYRVNLVGEAAYQYLMVATANEPKKKTDHVFSVGAGPALYFNSSVALELTLNYETASAPYYTLPHNTLFVDVGFQFHINKEVN